MKPKQLISIVCKYYGIKDIKALAPTVRPGSTWKYPIMKEARRVACMMLQRHCALTLAELADELQWSHASIMLWAREATRMYAEDPVFKLSVEGVEKMVLITLMLK